MERKTSEEFNKNSESKIPVTLLPSKEKQNPKVTFYSIWKRNFSAVTSAYICSRKQYLK